VEQAFQKMEQVFREMEQVTERRGELFDWQMLTLMLSFKQKCALQCKIGKSPVKKQKFIMGLLLKKKP